MPTLFHPCRSITINPSWRQTSAPDSEPEQCRKRRALHCTFIRESTPQPSGRPLPASLHF
ncbi:MAG: hypothetical protein AB2705_18640 [Candidatus Thiodiazotropha sp.]